MARSRRDESDPSDACVAPCKRVCASPRSSPAARRRSRGPRFAGRKRRRYGSPRSPTVAFPLLLLTRRGLVCGQHPVRVGACTHGRPPSGRSTPHASRHGRAAVYSVLAGLLGALVAGPLLKAMPGNVWALQGLGSLLVLAVGRTHPRAARIGSRAGKRPGTPARGRPRHTERGWGVSHRAATHVLTRHRPLATTRCRHGCRTLHRLLQWQRRRRSVVDTRRLGCRRRGRGTAVRSSRVPSSRSRRAGPSPCLTSGHQHAAPGPRATFTTRRPSTGRAGLRRRRSTAFHFIRSLTKHSGAPTLPGSDHAPTTVRALPRDGPTSTDTDTRWYS